MIENNVRDAEAIARAFWEELHSGQWSDLQHFEKLPWFDAAYELLASRKIKVGGSLFVGVG